MAFARGQGNPLLSAVAWRLYRAPLRELPMSTFRPKRFSMIRDDILTSPREWRW